MTFGKSNKLIGRHKEKYWKDSKLIDMMKDVKHNHGKQQRKQLKIKNAHGYHLDKN